MPLQKQEKERRCHIRLCSRLVSVGRNCASNWDLKLTEASCGTEADAAGGRGMEDRLVLKRLTGGE